MPTPPDPRPSPDDKAAAYRRFRALSPAELGAAIGRFQALDAVSRRAEAGLIRAAGVNFASAPEPARARVRAWMVSLLDDPDPLLRRYAVRALPKLRSGPAEESALLALLTRTTPGREREHLLAALEKIGGAATLDALRAEDVPASPAAEQKVLANIARQTAADGPRLDRVLHPPRNLRVHLRGRQGLEKIVAEECTAHPALSTRFRVLEVSKGLVALGPTGPFSLGDLFALRCFGTLSLVLGLVKTSSQAGRTEDLARIIASPRTRRLFAALHEGPPRYRLEFMGGAGHARQVQEVAARAFALSPEILNDSHRAPWAIEIHPTRVGDSVEMRPRVSPDPRFAYRRDDVAAASHPPLAASLARSAGRPGGPEDVWDPFCGSGLELVESALLGGVRSLHGTDLSPEAIAAARANLAAAGLPGLRPQLTCCDFRACTSAAHIRPHSLSLVITNPPHGRRLRIPDLPSLISDLLLVSAQVLRPGGRLVFTNPVTLKSIPPALRRVSRHPVDLGGYTCQLETYQRTGPA